MAPEQDIQQFKIRMLRKMPFYGDIIARLPFVEDESIPTAATDGAKIMYNPHFLNQYSEAQRNFILMHEVLHVLLLHCSRCKDRDPWIYNIAANYIVNDMLVGCMSQFLIPLEMPEDALYASLERDETVENLYGKILADNQHRMNNGKTLILRKTYRSAEYKPQEHPVPPAESGKVGGDLMPAALSDLQQELQAQEIRKLISQALRSAKLRGDTGHINIPGQILQIVETKRLNWKSLLKNMLTDVQSEESSYATPERKYLHMDMILPGHGETAETLEDVWAFVDCSGSISHDEAEAFLSQLYRILKEFHCTMHVAYWDTAVGNVYRNITSKEELLKAIPMHSGGTDINCIYRWIRKNRVKPDCMLVLTDGYFGNLNENNCRLRWKTIVVLSKDSARIDDNIRSVGKPASL